MTKPNILFYALMQDVTGDNKTSKYRIIKQVGYYPPMDALRGKDGTIHFYLLPSKDSGSTKDNAPAMKLQGKNSLNFTGLKEYYKGGKLSGFSYGYPLDKETYSKKEIRNPFYEHKEDCFLFIMHNDEASANSQRPSAIELIVLKDAKVLGAAYLEQLAKGGFETELKQMRDLSQ